MESLELWKKNLYEAIKNIADLDSQKVIWLGKSPNYESSFDEYMMSLFDDFDIDRFILKKNWLDMKLPEILRLKIEDLKLRLNEYQGKPTDSQILEDPKWREITEQAKEVIEVWDRNR